jgi:hypothetical protein
MNFYGLAKTMKSRYFKILNIYNLISSLGDTAFSIMSFSITTIGITIIKTRHSA